MEKKTQSKITKTSSSSSSTSGGQKKKVPRDKNIRVNKYSHLKNKLGTLPPKTREWSERVGQEPDPEDTQEDFDINDPPSADKYYLLYPPPTTSRFSSHPLYQQKWKMFLPDIAVRNNFKQGHLSQLDILCRLYVELEELEVAIKKHGYTYDSISKNGVTIKPRPEVTQKNRVLSEIRNYSKILGLLLVKDTTFTDPAEKDDNWG